MNLSFEMHIGECTAHRLYILYRSYYRHIVTTNINYSLLNTKHHTCHQQTRMLNISHVKQTKIVEYVLRDPFLFPVENAM